LQLCVLYIHSLLHIGFDYASLQLFWFLHVKSSHGSQFLESTGFISNLIGDKRPLNSSEINSLFFNSLKTGFVRSLSLAFSQIAVLEDVRNLMLI